MNYYEQFYDDLEFEPEDYGRRDPRHYPPDDRYHHDPYRGKCYMDDPYHREPPHSQEYERDRYRHERGFPVFEREARHDRGFPDFPREDEYGVSPAYLSRRGRGERPPRGRDERHPRGRGNSQDMSRGRGRVNTNFITRNLDSRGGANIPRGCGERGNSNSGSGRGNNRGRGSSDRGRGSSDRGRGGGMSMNFVKASDTDNASENDKTDSNKTQTSSDQIRFDYKAFQNEPSQVEKEVEQALKAYKCQLGFGYGYGPRSDLVDGEQPEWLISGENNVAPDTSNVETVNSTQSDSQYIPPTAQNKPEVVPPKNNVKTAMINPAFNFVKAKSEFHSIDVAFHETPKVEENKPTPNSLSVNFGNKRVGLGFGVSANKVSNYTDAQTSAMVTRFHASAKNGTSAPVDSRFIRLQEAVKARNLPNKNAIEILHMAVDKVKMAITDDIASAGRTRSGQPLFICRLLIDGVSIAQGQAAAKKAAKHEAYQKALTVFTDNESLTVKEISSGVFELRKKDTEFKVPAPIGPQGYKPQTLRSPLMTNNTATVNKTPVKSATSNNSSAPKQNNQTYSKPKMVFHQPSHPLSDKPLEFQSEQDTPPTHGQTEPKQAEALAMKLLNFVKEGQSVTNKSESNDTTSSSNATAPSSNATASRPTSQLRDFLASIASSPSSYGSPKTHQQHQTQSRMNQNSLGKRPSNMLKTRSWKVKVPRMELNDLSEFIIIDNSDLHAANGDQLKLRALSTLHVSANFNKVVLKVDYEECDDGQVSCSLILSDIIVAIGKGANKEEAKSNAGSEAMHYLKECCYTIKVKQHVDSDNAGLSKEQLLSDLQKSDSGSSSNVAIPSSNIGNMLLRKMGWVGGGVGKDGTGIAEPVKADMVIGREGLGLSAEKGLSKNFTDKVSKLLQEYIKSNDQGDLHFSPELTKEERAAIHKIGQKFGLKTESKGSKKIGSERYLIVSRKRSARELLDHIKSSGGSTSKYELIPPENSDFDITRREDISHGHCKQ